jgi:HlyD family secretion protein
MPTVDEERAVKSAIAREKEMSPSMPMRESGSVPPEPAAGAAPINDERASRVSAATPPARRGHLKARAIMTGVIVLIASGIAYALRPKPLNVETAVAATGPMRVTVDADAVTRVRQSFMVAAPVGGLVQRIAVRAGDLVRAGDSIASIATPPLFSTERRAVQARVDAALAAQLQFDARLSQASLALAQAERDEARANRLVEAGAVAERDVELAKLTVANRRAELGTVRAQRRVALAELAEARAALDAAVGHNEATTIVRAPGDGRVLSVPQSSARVVAAGTPLLELGDPGALEVTADVLSSDAALVRVGQAVILRGWGGTPLNGVVRVVEPSAHTRISALGVEEQRLTVVIDPSPVPPSLGDGYRLDASIVVWEGNALTVPASALLRGGNAWDVFAVRNGRAVRERVSIGHVGGGVAEVTSGLKAGDRVVIFPPDVLRDGDRVRETR